MRRNSESSSFCIKKLATRLLVLEDTHGCAYCNGEKPLSAADHMNPRHALDALAMTTALNTCWSDSSHIQEHVWMNEWRFNWKNPQDKKDLNRTLRGPTLVRVAAWHGGNVVGRINEVTLRLARSVLGWVTVFGGQTTSVFHQTTQAKSAAYPQRDGKWVPAKVRWCSAAGE